MEPDETPYNHYTDETRLAKSEFMKWNSEDEDLVEESFKPEKEIINADKMIGWLDGFKAAIEEVESMNGSFGDPPKDLIIATLNHSYTQQTKKLKEYLK